MKHDWLKAAHPDGRLEYINGGISRPAPNRYRKLFRYGLTDEERKAAVKQAIAMQTQDYPEMLKDYEPCGTELCPVTWDEILYWHPKAAEN